MRWIWRALVPLAALLAGCGPSQVRPAVHAMPPPAGLESSIVAAAWPGPAGSRLVVADTLGKKLRIYRLAPDSIRLVAVRGYKYDLMVGATPPARGAGFTYREIQKLAEQRLSKAALRRPLQGKETLLVTGDEARVAGRIILISPAEKRILAYRLLGSSLRLVAARPYNHDEVLLHTSGAAPRGGYTYEEVRKMVASVMKKGAGDGTPLPEVRAAKIRDLTEQLGHRLSSVRRAAAMNLGKMDPPAVEARPALKKALTDKSSSVRQAAAKALKKIKAAEQQDRK
jgi:HEAT repeats